MRNRLRVAISDGDWSDPSIWNDNSVPEERDIVSLNGQHVVLDQDVTVFGLNNMATEAINSYTYLVFNDEPEGVAESSDNSPYAWMHFRESGGARNFPGVTQAYPYWISYEYPNQEPIILKSYQFNGQSSNHPYNPTSWLFQAWDGTNWVTLEDRTNYGANYTTYTGNLSSNTTAYYKYRFYITQLQGGYGYTTMNISRVRFFEYKSYSSNSIEGGDLTINDSKTLTVTGQPIESQGYDLIYCNGDGSNTINLNLSSKLNRTQNKYSIKLQGVGTCNIVGEIIQWPSYYNTHYGGNIIISNPCTLNVTGDVGAGGINSYTASGILLNSGGSNSIINIIGDVKSGGGINVYGLHLDAAANVTITGDVYGAQPPIAYGGGGVYSSNTGVNLTVVGNIYGGKPTNYAYTHIGIHGNFNNLSITGNMTTYSGYNNHSISFSDVAGLGTLIGTVESTSENPVVVSSRYADSRYYSDLTFSGPFISSPTGTLPIMVRNMKVIPALNNYFQTRDASLNVYNLVDPTTVVDAPPPRDVREGTSYALGTYTGTLAVPLPSQVALGIATDDTTGTGVLSASDVWSEQVSNITTAGSIGERLKNASTVESNGDQLESFL